MPIEALTVEPAPLPGVPRARGLSLARPTSGPHVAAIRAADRSAICVVPRGRARVAGPSVVKNCSGAWYSDDRVTTRYSDALLRESCGKSIEARGGGCRPDDGVAGSATVVLLGVLPLGVVDGQAVLRELTPALSATPFVTLQRTLTVSVVVVKGVATIGLVAQACPATRRRPTSGGPPRGLGCTTLPVAARTGRTTRNVRPDASMARATAMGS